LFAEDFKLGLYSKVVNSVVVRALQETASGWQLSVVIDKMLYFNVGEINYLTTGNIFLMPVKLVQQSLLHCVTYCRDDLAHTTQTTQDPCVQFLR